MKLIPITYYIVTLSTISAFASAQNASCYAPFPGLLGDGSCDGGLYNTPECDSDDGDCIDFNLRYPNCTVKYPYFLADGFCDGGDYNTLECGSDDGDCDRFNELYPTCTADLSLLGDGSCDTVANNTGCGFDDGDCMTPKGKKKSKKSKNPKKSKKKKSKKKKSKKKKSKKKKSEQPKKSKKKKSNKTPTVSPAPTAPKRCSIDDFYKETFMGHVPGTTICYRLQLYKSGTFEIDENNNECASAFVGTTVISKFYKKGGKGKSKKNGSGTTTGVGGNMIFIDGEGWNGSFTFTLDTSLITSLEAEVITWDTNAKKFNVNLVVPKCGTQAKKKKRRSRVRRVENSI